METDWGEAPREDIGQEALEHVHDAPAWKRTHAPATPAAALADASAAAAPATPAAAPLQPRPVAVPAVVPPLADATPAAAPLQPRPVAMPAIVPPLAEAGAPARRPHCQWVCLLRKQGHVAQQTPGPCESWAQPPGWPKRYGEGGRRGPYLYRTSY